MNKFGSFVKSLITWPKDHETNRDNTKNKGYKWLGIGNFGFDRYDDKELIQEGFVSNADIYAIITSISRKAADIDILTVKDGEVIDTGLTYDLVNGDVTKHFSSKIEEAVINYSATGDAFFELIESSVFSGSYARIDTLRSDSVEVVCNDLNIVTSYEYQENGFSRSIKVENVVHVKAYNPLNDELGNQRGMSPMQPGKRVLNASNSAEVASSVIFENQGVSGIISDKSGSLNDEDEALQLQNAIDKKLSGAHKAGKYTVTSAEVEVHQLGMSSKDMELSKSAPLTLRKMAAIFGVSSRQYNDPQGTTYNNAETDAKNFYINGVIPVLNKITKTLSLKFQEIDGSIIIPNYEAVEVLQSDKKKEVEKNKLQAESIIAVLTSEITTTQKIEILVSVHGYDEDSAKNLVGNG